jgi:hypothetical protein
VSRQYKRAYSLSISTDGVNRNITGLRVSFKITKSLMSFPNLAEIEIYNPNKDTLSKLQTRYTDIALNAGYEGNVRLIFKGQIRNVFQRKMGPDRIVTVFAGDGEADWQNSIFNKTLSENIALKQIVTEIAQSFVDTTLGVLQGLDTPADKLRGQTLSGSSKDILDKLAEDYGFQWSIQDGNLITVPNEQVLENENAVLINQVTGMIGSPTITELGVNVTTLLNPELSPNRAFQVESAFADVAIGGIQFRELPRTSGEGLYKAFQVTFDGDTHGDNWFSVVEGRILNV